MRKTTHFYGFSYDIEVIATTIIFLHKKRAAISVSEILLRMDYKYLYLINNCFLLDTANFL